MMQSLESIPAWFGDFTGISLEASQMILSVVVILAILLPTMYLSRGTRAVMIEIVMLFLSMSLLVGIGWLPFWILIATVALIAMGVASLGTKVVTGG